MMKVVTLKTDPGQKPIRLDQFLSKQISNLSRSKAQELVHAGLVSVDEKTVIKPSYQIAPLATINIQMPTRREVTIEPQNIPLDIIHEDQDLIIINKAPGMVVHPAHGNWDHTLINAVLAHIQSTNKNYQVECLGLVHRLDKGTSGLVILAKSDEAKTFIQKQFADRQVQKTYLALVEGDLSPDRGSIDSPIGRDKRDRKKMDLRHDGKKALTDYKVLQKYRSAGNTYTLIKASPHTGRTHQIRVHLASTGHPLVGDPVYGHEHTKLKRQFLHAHSILFRMPDGKKKKFEAALWKDLNEFLSTLEES